MEHARLRKQTCTPDHCEHWPVLQGDPLYHRVMCDMSSIPTRFAGPLGRQRLTAAGKPHSEWPGGKYPLTPAVVFVKRRQNMHADSLIRTRLLKPPATAVPSGASPLTGTSCLLAEAESASKHACRLRSSCNSFLSVRSVHWPSEHVSPVSSRSPHWHRDVSLTFFWPIIIDEEYSSDWIQPPCVSSGAPDGTSAQSLSCGP